jgi:hypothetical protein
MVKLWPAVRKSRMVQRSNACLITFNMVRLTQYRKALNGFWFCHNFCLKQFLFTLVFMNLCLMCAGAHAYMWLHVRRSTCLYVASCAQEHAPTCEASYCGLVLTKTGALQQILWNSANIRLQGNLFDGFWAHRQVWQRPVHSVVPANHEYAKGWAHYNVAIQMGSMELWDL